MKVNCAAIPDGLIESELFGHVKGAFTDAKGDRAGKFSQAHGGTLFLDEIGEMPLSVQAKVLRALENGEIEPLGAEKVTKVDVRIIAATNRDLNAMVGRKEFRQDLYYRLNVLKIPVPPLRDHLDDLDALATSFLNNFCAENGLAALSFTPAAVGALKKTSVARQRARTAQRRPARRHRRQWPGHYASGSISAIAGIGAFLARALMILVRDCRNGRAC